MDTAPNASDQALLPPPFDLVTQISNNNASNAAAAVGGRLERTTLERLNPVITLTAAALAIIFIGAHGSLRRPPSAAPAKKRKRASSAGRPDKCQNADGECEGTCPELMVGFQASDAIVMPLIASVTLIGLYFLIRWLNDPILLNRIFRLYFSVVGIASQTTFFAHALTVGSTLVFPRLVRGLDGVLWQIADGGPTRRGWRRIGGGGGDAAADDATAAAGNHEGEGCILPGPAIWMANEWAERISRLFEKLTGISVWDVRRLCLGDSELVMTIRGTGESVLARFSCAHLLALPLAIVTGMMYHWTSSHWLGNLMGAALCYGVLIWLSMTSFLIGTLVLFGYFIYDIIMVFKTPFMVGVATTLDVPIKLTFKGPVGQNILGLGDIALPGVFICLALRFDLYLYFHRKITYQPLDLESEAEDIVTGKPGITTEATHRAIKPAFADPTTLWFERIGETVYSWVARRDTDLPQQLPARLEAASFPRPYFWATMLGYTAGMVATLAALLWSGHGQPALLYLVPSTTGALWLAGWARGELGLMREYTEDGSLYTEDAVVEVSESGGMVFKPLKRHEAIEKSGEVAKEDEETQEKTTTGGGDKEGEKQNEETDRGSRTLFTISLRTPPYDELVEHGH